jgi:hypothetical protein
MGTRSSLAKLSREVYPGLEAIDQNIVSLDDANVFTARPDFSAGILSGDASILAAGTGHVLTGADAGKTVVFNAAAATTVKLPAPELGMVFNFVTAVTATADHVIQAATNDHGFLGGVLFMNTTADQTDAFAAAADGNNDFITMNGTTSGGHAGSHWRIVAVLDASAAKCWIATGTTIGSGAAVTPFGDAQI